MYKLIVLSAVIVAAVSSQQVFQNKFAMKEAAPQMMIDIDEPFSMQSQPGLVAAVLALYPVAASSEFDPNHGIANSRIGSQHSRVNSHSWCASYNDANQWIGVSLLGFKRVMKVATQGRSDARQWITQYRVQYTKDGATWFNADNGRVFFANTDNTDVVNNTITTPFFARAVRIAPVAWNGHISTKFEVYFEE